MPPTKSTRHGPGSGSRSMFKRAASNYWGRATLLLGTSLGLPLRPARQSAPGRTSKRPRPVLILNAGSLTETVEAGYWAASGVDAVFRDIGEIAITVATSAIRVYETVDGRDLSDFGLVHVAAYPAPTATLVNAIAAYLEHWKVRGINLAGIGAPTNLLHYVLLAQAGLRVPVTRYVPVRLMRDSYHSFAEQLGQPFIVKNVRGGRPDDLIVSDADLAARLSDADEKRDVILAQELIPGNNTLCVFVFGGTEAVAILRDSLGVTAEGQVSDCVTLADPAELDPAARRLAIHAATVLKYDVASVDLVQHWTTGEWYVLQVSPSPALSKGPYVLEKLGAYSSFLERRARS